MGQVSSWGGAVLSPIGDPGSELAGSESSVAGVDGGGAGGGQQPRMSGLRNEISALPSLAGFGMAGSVSPCKPTMAFLLLLAFRLVRVYTDLRVHMDLGL